MIWENWLEANSSETTVKYFLSHLNADLGTQARGSKLLACTTVLVPSIQL